MRINLTLAPLTPFFRVFFFFPRLRARFLRRRQGATQSLSSRLRQSRLLRWLLCLLPLPGIKLRGGCLYSRGFSNYMFNLFSRPLSSSPPLLPSRPRDFPARRVTAGEGGGRGEIPPWRFRGRRRAVLSHPLVKATRTLWSTERGAWFDSISARRNQSLWGAIIWCFLNGYEGMKSLFLKERYTSRNIVIFYFI